MKKLGSTNLNQNIFTKYVIFLFEFLYCIKIDLKLILKTSIPELMLVFVKDIPLPLYGISFLTIGIKV